MEITNDQMLKCHAIIHGASASAAAIGGGLAQIPLSDTVLITPIQITMVISLGSVLDVELTRSAAAAILGTVAAGAIGRGVSQVLLGWIPGVGNAINASTAAAITEAAGCSAVTFFENLSDEELKKLQEEREKGRQDAKVEFNKKIKEINEKYAKVCERLKEYEQYEFFVLGAFSIGIAAESIDGEISKESRSTLEIMTAGLGYNLLPDHVKRKVSELFYEKPTFNSAMKVIEKVERVHWTIFNDIVDAVLETVDSENEKKEDFRTAWNENYYAS